MRPSLLAASLLCALGLAAGCNSLAGIADYHTVLDAGDGGHGGGGGAAPSAGSTGAQSSGTQGSGGSPLPSCTGADVPLRITVLDSTSGAYNGISEHHGPLFTFLPLGDTFDKCVPKDVTLIELHSEPTDPSKAIHDWGVCGMAQRCKMTITGPTVIEVHLD